MPEFVLGCRISSLQVGIGYLTDCIVFTNWHFQGSRDSRSSFKFKLGCVQAQAQAQAQQAAVEAHQLDHTAQQLQVKAHAVSYLHTNRCLNMHEK